MSKHNGCYVKLATDPTFWLVEDDQRRIVHNAAEMYAHGLRPVTVIGNWQLVKIPIANEAATSTTLFSHLADYRVILVTGPHRSGTTITAQMIASDSNLAFLPEEAFGPQNYENWQKLVRDTTGGVIQCPSMCRYAHEFASDPTVAVVLVRRAIPDILASQEKVRWTEGGLAQYGRELGWYEGEGKLAEVKYAFWDAEQRDQIAHAFEITYESLDTHPLWVPKALRKDFHPRQTEL